MVGKELKREQNKEVSALDSYHFRQVSPSHCGLRLSTLVLVTDLDIRYRHNHICLSVYSNLKSAVFWIGILSYAPELVQHKPITPHVTGTGELLVGDRLRCRPFDWEQKLLRHVVVWVVHQLSRHPKISNL